jgi:hypothetical protein
MNSRDIRNLQEAYIDVYQELDEAKVEENEEDWRKGQIRNLRRHKSTGTTTPYTDRLISHTKGRGKKTKGTQEEEVELYDLIIEYLIQEGYADSLGPAEIILENMSEEWMEEILNENILTSAAIAAGRGMKPKPKTSTLVPDNDPSLAPDNDPRVSGRVGGSSIKKTDPNFNKPLATLNRSKAGDNFIGPTVSAGNRRYGIPNVQFSRYEGPSQR